MLPNGIFMNPTLKKLSSRCSRENVILLIRKHVGNSPSDYLCRQAYEACLERCSDEITNELKRLFNVLKVLNSEEITYEERCFNAVDSYAGEESRRSESAT